MEIEFRTLDKFPRPRLPEWKRQFSKFGASYLDTYELLERELKHLKAERAVVEVACTHRDLTRDGRLRAGARLPDPAVVLRVFRKGKTLTFPCDRFTDWEDNFRAIALALEALRKVERYGVTSSGEEQYRGWEALPEPEGFPTSREEAAKVLADGTEYLDSQILQSPVVRDSAYRARMKRAHPDIGGSHLEAARVNRAMELLGGRR